ncbi:MAG: CDP-alcohol phosphatidyltransferase family protein [Dehalococcoidia bacterium]|nr:CDP-alcohol phosphatidyltransferase family protein [Dehalococcoidia bacterium]
MTSANSNNVPSAEASRQRLKIVATRYLVSPIVRVLVALRVTPDTLTWLGLAGGGGAAALLWSGHWVWGGVAVLASSALDMLDGALARATGAASKYGALLDSTLDRVGEAVILFGMLGYYARRGDTEETLLLFAAVVGSGLVSYVKARTEGLGIPCNVGLVTRPERIIILGTGLLAGHIATVIALYLITVLSFVTAAHRFLDAGRRARQA